MHAAGKRTSELLTTRDRRKTGDAGFLDSRDLDGRPADDYGLDWLRQQGLLPPLPLSVLRAALHPLLWQSVQPIIPLFKALLVPWQRFPSGSGKKPCGRLMAASGGCARAARFPPARPPSTRHSPSEQLSTGVAALHYPLPHPDSQPAVAASPFGNAAHFCNPAKCCACASM